MSVLWLQLITILSLWHCIHGKCREDQYEHKSGQQIFCCDSCVAGEFIKNECTATRSTSECVKCKPGYYNPATARSSCKTCKVCDKSKGSIQIQPCTASSNTVCACPLGSRSLNKDNTACECESGKEIVNNKCQPCAFGYFSSAKDTTCRPWTNCSAEGQTVLENGSTTQDVKCSKAKDQTTVAILRTVISTSSHPQSRPTIDQMTPSQNPFITFNQPPSSRFYNWEMVTLILFSVTLLLLLAGIIMAMVIQTKKKSGNKGFIRGKRCKVPVQEESSGSDSSLAKTCPV
ncbi:tumor necrosis factor receptor superfamily member 4-like [Hyperolius riggenbachi]|uniref:tumor necrosis factor receptor superfamily member 4-like n=1 Tax=Hyperolius riggenbachi TaxID=752182 RepID=UPI0035A2C521